jgi:hypothetical protein
MNENILGNIDLLVRAKWLYCPLSCPLWGMRPDHSPPTLLSYDVTFGKEDTDYEDDKGEE